MMTLRPRLTRTLRSFIRCGGRDPRPARAEDKIFPLCNGISAATAFTFLPLALSPRTLAKVARLIYQTQVPSRKTRAGRPASRPTPLSFVPLYEMSSERLAPFSPGRRTQFQIPFTSGGREKRNAKWMAVRKQLALQQKYIFVHECRRWKTGLAKVLSLHSPLLACCKVFSPDRPRPTSKLHTFARERGNLC